MIGQYRMPLITSIPFFVNAPQFDMFELMYFTVPTRPSRPAPPTPPAPPAPPDASPAHSFVTR